MNNQAAIILVMLLWTVLSEIMKIWSRQVRTMVTDQGKKILVSEDPVSQLKGKLSVIYFSLYVINFIYAFC